MTRRKLFLFSGPDESTLQRPEIIETTSEEERNKNIIRKAASGSGSPFLFSFVLRHALCCCLQLFSRSLPLSSCVSTFQRLCLCLSGVVFSQMPIPCSRLRSSLPLLLIPRGFSPVIHPGQATIPYKASGSPHLASYFHIRSAVTDRVYTGSSLECELAPPLAVPQALPCSPLLGANLVAPPPLSPPLLSFQFHLLSPLFARISPRLTFLLPPRAALIVSNRPNATNTVTLPSSFSGVCAERGALRWLLMLSS